MASREEKPAFALQSMLSLWVVLFVVWMVANSTLAIEVALTGALITLGLAYVFSSRSGAWQKIRWTPARSTISSRTAGLPR